MRRNGATCAVCLGLAVLLASPASAQYRALILGHMRDAVTGAPIQGAVLITADGATSAISDAQGNFTVQVTGDAPYILSAVGVGYQTRRFELPASARVTRSVLQLEPAPIGAMVRLSDRVRVASPETSGDFAVTHIGGSSLVLQESATAQPVEVPIASLQRLAIHRGREVSRGEGVFGGGAFGGVLGLAFGFQCAQSHFDCITGLSFGSNLLVGAGVGAVAGFLVSGASPEAWEEVRLPGAPLDEAPLELPRSRAGESFVGQPSSDGVELVVRNRLPSPVTAFVWWEGTQSAVLGDVGPGSVRTFRSERRGQGVAVFVEVLSDPGLNPRRGQVLGTGFIPDSVGARPEPDRNPRRGWLRDPRFVPINVGDRIEWTVLRSTSGLVEDHLLVPRR